ncbi:hypothetical protein PpBr36_09078 [Pyricularia pennisetigena]|uniref:hypothetical protein n=1 Tax=Pyricularia pennisetigena TaxID=1578925 RepID=UPI001151803E|nr:hypothetical protein PpBr36_09078 [Pyricularia pennisetigena]TLS24891.1 hypothetical protein PpBr36_09078 [Pyricularia pennisetigena]
MEQVNFQPTNMNSERYNSSSAAPAPEFHPLVRLGNLSRIDGTPIEFDIVGVHTKGFKNSAGEWSCYRRNYFSCTGSYTLNPPQPQSTTIQFLNISERVHSVSGFAISFSVVKAGEKRPIQFVQYTAKRDKGPVLIPGKIRLEPMPAQPQISNAWVYMVQHTFERLQFKRATPNNGNRPAPQNYYHLEIEFWVDVGNDQDEEWIKIGYRRSVRLIVRGRSPGHYNNTGQSMSGVPEGRSGYGRWYGCANKVFRIHTGRGRDIFFKLHGIWQIVLIPGTSLGCDKSANRGGEQCPVDMMETRVLNKDRPIATCPKGVLNLGQAAVLVSQSRTELSLQPLQQAAERVVLLVLKTEFDKPEDGSSCRSCLAHQQFAGSSRPEAKYSKQTSPVCV